MGELRIASIALVAACLNVGVASTDTTQPQPQQPQPQQASLNIIDRQDVGENGTPSRSSGALAGGRWRVSS